MEIKASYEVESSAEQIWHVVGERFGEVAEWADGLRSSRLVGELGVGCERVCSGEPNWPFPGGTVRERLLTFDRADLSLSYEVFEGLPRFFSRAVSRWRVVPLGSDRARVDIHGSLELRGLGRWLAPVLGPLIRRMGRRALVDLARYVVARQGEMTAVSTITA